MVFDRILNIPSFTTASFCLQLSGSLLSGLGWDTIFCHLGLHMPWLRSKTPFALITSIFLTWQLPDVISSFTQGEFVV